VQRFTRSKADSNHGSFLKTKELIKRELKKLKTMHPKELTQRERLLQELSDHQLSSGKESIHDVIHRQSKLNDGLTFKSKFYRILHERIHQEGSFLA